MDRPPIRIRIRLPGGLGNQLFAFAAGLSISKSRRSIIELEIGSVDYSHAGPGIDIRDLLSLEKFKFYKSRMQSPIVKRVHDSLLYRIPSLRRFHGNLFNVIRDDDLAEGQSYSDLFEAYLEKETRKQIQLQGYFQDFSIVSDVRDRLISFIKEDFSPQGNVLLSALDSKKVLGIHVRGGDFLNANWAALVGNLSSLYYLNAINKLTDMGFSFDEIWVFTNDLPYARRLVRDLDFDFKFVDNNLIERPAENFNLMRRCSGVILSNSSFSYMASFLSDKAQVVVAPESFSKSGSQIGGIPKLWIEEKVLWQ